MFKEFENETVVFIGLVKYGLDSIPPEIGKLKSVEELIISQDSVMGWTIYPPANAMEKMVDMPPYKTIPDELTELKSLKKLNISGLRIRTLPPNFGQLKNLEYLDISMNKLDIKKEITKLKSLPNLKGLSIVGNRIDSTEIAKWNDDNSEIEIIF
ncbi:leucine-rich repeat domain-containing protein [Maribacter antarcticus]|uniref:leucine-rich repeat domain-containing protein n=1 Tax=Maribacter antarcticus TaxID=505250 RepID=UPI00047E8142|nr:leucine-rich repeat domain-containing protein [Maribacter antarcticus]